jgi:hypothetical protein
MMTRRGGVIQYVASPHAYIRLPNLRAAKSDYTYTEHVMSFLLTR